MSEGRQHRAHSVRVTRVQLQQSLAGSDRDIAIRTCHLLLEQSVQGA
jgi:hypothetical protein